MCISLIVERKGVNLTYKVGRCLLKYHLHKNNMTQKELAVKIGKTEQTISRYANNQNMMSYETAMNIASILNCAMEDLYKKVKK